MDAKFNVFMYFLIDDLEEVKKEKDPAKKARKLQKIIDFLRNGSRVPEDDDD